MPICFMPGGFHGKDEEARDEALGVSRTASIKSVLAGPLQEWREPPGYLGEAVRRAKRIGSLGHPDEPPKSSSKDC
jgi:hypothetical protein